MTLVRTTQIIAVPALLAGLGIAAACSDTSNLGDNQTIDGGGLFPGTDGPCGEGLDRNGNGVIDEGCTCTPGTTEACFRGLPTVRKVGACKDGTIKCQGSGEFGTWGSACEGDVLPAPEACNEIDDDCNGAVDEGCSCTAGESRACMTELAGEGQCKAGTQLCGSDGKWATCGGSVGPAVEACGDKVDNDCDGKVDEGCDTDAGVEGGSDTGAPDTSVPDTGPCEATAAPPRPIAPTSTGRVSTWKPTLRWVLPQGATGARVTLCRDRACSSVITQIDATGSSVKLTQELTPGVVYWKLERLSADGAGCAPSATWEFTVGPRDSQVDSSWGTQLDVDGDGYADVMVSAKGGGSADGTGHVYLFRGGPSGIATTPTSALSSPASGASGFGFGISGAGDVNGDGYADAIVGSWGWYPTPGCSDSNKTGYTTDEAYLYLGGPTGLSPTPVVTLPGPTPRSACCDCAFFGGSTTAAGDVNGDGYADVMVAAVNKHKVYLYYGASTGLDPTPVILTGGYGSSSGATPRTMTGIGDVNGDGYADIALGSEQAGVQSALYMGGANGISTTPIYLSIAGNFKAGQAVVGGDMNGDGYADLLCFESGGLNTGDKLIYVYHGGAPGLATTPSTTVDSPQGLTTPQCATSDMNGDGFSDATTWGNWASDYQPMDFYLGSASGLGATPSASLSAPANGNWPWFGLSGAGDVNGDGYQDLIVGIPADSFASVAGKGILYYGNASGLNASQSQTIPSPLGYAQESTFGNHVGAASGGM